MNDQRSVLSARAREQRAREREAALAHEQAATRKAVAATTAESAEQHLPYGSPGLDPFSAAGSSMKTSMATSLRVSMPLTNASVRRPSASSMIARN